MSYCTKCGEKLNDEAIFCTNCGQELADKPSTIMPETDPIPFESTKWCTGCGAQLSSEQVFCDCCGQRCEELAATPQSAYDDATKGNVSEAKAPSNVQEYRNDPRVMGILTKYGTKRMLLRQIPFVIIMLIIAILLILDENANAYTKEDILFASACIKTFIALMVVSVYGQPRRYTAKRRKKLMLCGYNLIQVKTIISENPLFGVNNKTKVKYAGLIRAISYVVFTIGWIIAAYGVYQAIFPFLAENLIPKNLSKLQLYVSGLSFFTIGVLTAYLGKILRGLSKR